MTVVSVSATEALEQAAALLEQATRMRTAAATQGIGGANVKLPEPDVTRTVLALREALERVLLGEIDRARLPLSTRRLIERVEAAEAELADLRERSRV